MNEINDGGPAFPSLPVQMQIDESTGMLSPLGFDGMSLRDWFAAAASDNDIASIESDFWDDKGEWVKRTRAERRYIFADTMIKARVKA